MQNWMRRLTQDGVVFYPPEGRDAAWLRVRERVRPLRTLREIREQQAASLPGATVKMGDVKRIVTAEGEHAVSYVIRVEEPEKIQITVGIIFGDDSFTLIESMCTAPELAENLVHTTESLTHLMPIGLGLVRRRRYEYSAPEGWQAVVRDRGVSWYPTDFPKRRAVIRVFDAVPAKDSPSMVLARRLFDDPQTELTAITDSSMFTVLTDTGLNGVYEITRGSWSDGSPSAIIRVTLSDPVYAYNMRLETSEPSITEANKLFDNLVRSVVPVPAPPTAETAGQLIHWAE